MGLQQSIESGKFVVLGEFEPPKGCDFSILLESANRVKGRLDAVVVPEMGNAVMKASSLGGCAFLERHGFETVMQACCRDRNRLALQADVLAAAAVGVRNLMVVTGEDISFGDHHQARAVFDLDLPQLLAGIETLQGGKDMAGIELRGSPKFFVGSVINAGATGGALELEIEELARKMDLGVRFVVTTPLFDLRRFQKLLNRIDTDRVSVIPTVMLLKSAGMARYIDRNIRHIPIPPEIIQSIQKASDKVRQCIEISGNIIRELKDMGVSGALISTVGWEDKLPQLLDEAKI